MGKISLVLPVYNEQVILKEVLEKYIVDLQNIRIKHQYQWEIIAVDDCSTDESRLIMLEFARQYQNFRIVTLAERVGKHTAVTAGLSIAKGDLVLTAEIDLQNPVGFLEGLFKEHLNSGVPIIYGYRQFNDSRRRRALFTDRMTRLACRLFVIDGYFTGIVNAELYTSDVVAVLRDNPSKAKYMRTMNNWVGWETKEYWYASEYTEDEIKVRMERMRKKTHQHYSNFKNQNHMAPTSVWWGILFLMISVLAFSFAIANLASAPTVVIGILFTMGFAGLVLTAMSFLRALLLARIGKLKYRAGETIYEIKSILNR